MWKSLEPLPPQNLVSTIVGNKIFLKRLTSQALEAVQELGANRWWLDREAGLEPIWLIECAGQEEVLKKLRTLNRLGFLFIGGGMGYPAADMFELILETQHRRERFKEALWRGPGDWFIVERYSSASPVPRAPVRKAAWWRRLLPGWARKAPKVARVWRPSNEKRIEIEKDELDIHGSGLDLHDWKIFRDVISPFLHAPEPRRLEISEVPEYLQDHPFMDAIRKYKETGEDQYLDQAGRCLVPGEKPFDWYVPLTK